MKGKLLAFLIPVVYVFALLLVASPAGVKAVEDIIVADGKNIPICHADSNVKKPYGPKITEVDDDSILKESGHSSHLGPVWSEGMVSGWGDIIPPFQYEKKGQTKIFTGLNWTDEGKAIWQNNCQIPGSTSEDEMCPWDDSMLGSDDLCVVCEWDDSIIASNPDCKEPEEPAKCELDESLLATDELYYVSFANGMTPFSHQILIVKSQRILRSVNGMRIC